MAQGMPKEARIKKRGTSMLEKTWGRKAQAESCRSARAGHAKALDEFLREEKWHGIALAHG